jgi:signal transduction histidine kinase
VRNPQKEKPETAEPAQTLVEAPSDTSTLDATASHLLESQFVGRARAVFWARLVFDALGLGVLLFPGWSRPLGVVLPEGLYVYLLLLAGHVASFLIIGHKGDRVVVFSSLCMDLLALLYLAASTGGLGSPVMFGQLVYTVFFAVLFPSPLAIMPPLLTLPVMAKVEQLLGTQVAPQDLLLLLWATFVNSVIVLVVVYLDRRRVANLREVLRLQKQRRLAALEEERARIAREMHDGLGALMSGVLIQTEYLQTQVSADSPLEKEIQELKEAAHETMEELRRTVSMMRDDFDPVATLEDYCLTWAGRTHTEIEFKSQGPEQQLSPDLSLCLYRTAQEALNNIAKHAAADRVAVTLTFASETVSLCIADDGKGFDLKEKKTGHYGVENMRKRAVHLEGTLKLDSTPQAGTSIELTLPLKNNRY